MKKTAILTPLLLAGCLPVVFPLHNPADDAPNPYGRWRIVEIDRHHPSEPDLYLTFNSTDNGFSAASSCLSVSGSRTHRGDGALSLRPEHVSDACTGGVPEQRLAALFGRVAGYRFGNRELVLSDAQGRRLVTARRLSRNRAAGRVEAGIPPTFGEARH